MLPGFNHNIKYRNMVFHVQTEDNGEENPLVISHLFIGGNIIATKKTNYSDLLGRENMGASVRAIMENQHKELIKELITGKYDSHPLVSGVQKHPLDIQPANTQNAETPKTDNTMPPEKIPPKQKDKSPFKPVTSASGFTVFGESTISEESLDKIILKFLKENKNQ